MKNKKLWISIMAGILAAVMLLSIIVSIIPVGADAASSSEIKEQINSLKDEKSDIQSQINALEKKVDANMSEMEKIVAEKDLIDQEVGLLYQQIDNINEQIRSYGLLIADKQTELDAARARLAELNEKNKERIRAMEEGGQLSYWSVLFRANSFSDLLDRLNMIQEIAASDQRRLQEMSAAAEQVANAQQALEEEKGALETTRTELDATQLTLEAKRVQADELLSDLNAKGEAYEAQIEEGEDEIEALLAQIAQKEEEYEEAKDREYQAWLKQWLATSVTTTAPTKPPATKPSGGSNTGGTGGTLQSSGWRMPCSYTKLTSPYGWRIHPVYGYRKFHSGVDLAGPKGTPIYASRSGTVTTATYSSSGGYYVTINHGDGYSSSYLHMTHYIVKKGEYVNAGQVIGYMGSTGVSTGSHLHFTIYYNGSTVNPAKYLKF